MEPYQRARAMIKAGLTILTENYKVEFQVYDVCETLKQAIEIMDTISENEKKNAEYKKSIEGARKIMEEMGDDFVPRPFDKSFGVED